MKRLAAAALGAGLLLVPGCAYGPPSNPDQICQILGQHLGWHKPLRQAWREWKLHPSIALAFIHQESRFIADARPPEVKARKEKHAEGAWGYGQALRDTWQDYRQRTGKLNASREKFADVVDFIGWYNHQSYIELRISRSDTDKLYLAFHEGRGGYERGSHLDPDKKWLREVAVKVDKRARMYRRQYRNCQARTDRNRYVRKQR